jgi:ribonuclease HII
LTLIAGIDDAGRGPVIGPLIIAGVLIHDHQQPHLRAIGVKDSKALSPRRRQWLAQQIKDFVVSYTWVELSPKAIDDVVFRGQRLRKLNWLEAKAMADVIHRLHPEVAYVDASDILERRFGEQIRELLSVDVDIVSEHHADVTYPVVSAASILAKTRRDQAVSELHEEYGDFGSGYSSDPRTRRFLREWFRTRGTEVLPAFVRASWKTIRTLKAEAGPLQTVLDEG